MFFHSALSDALDSMKENLVPKWMIHYSCLKLIYT